MTGFATVKQTLTRTSEVEKERFRSGDCMRYRSEHRLCGLGPCEVGEPLSEGLLGSPGSAALLDTADPLTHHG